MSAEKKFINVPTDSVKETIHGLLSAHPNTLSKLSIHDVVIHSKFNPNSPVYDVSNFNKIALLSGGGSGHEPAHAGFIGDGMLSAAICGGVFASPSVAGKWQ